MKQWICLGLILSLLLAGCGAKTEAPAQEPTPQIEETAPETKPEETPEDTTPPSSEPEIQKPEVEAEPEIPEEPEAEVGPLAYPEKAFSVAFLGYTADTIDPTQVMPLEELEQLEELEYDGDEHYIVMPNHQDYAITVYALDFPEGEPVRGEILTQTSAGQGLLLRCNVSDIMPNVELVIAFGEGEISYTPSISLKDGTLNLATTAQDLT